MARRVPRQKMYRAMLRGGLITQKDVPLLDRRMTDVARAKNLQNLFARNRGARFVDRLAALISWVMKHKSEIFRILGLVVLFAEDGTPYLVDEDSDEAKVRSVTQP